MRKSTDSDVGDTFPSFIAPRVRTVRGGVVTDISDTDGATILFLWPYVDRTRFDVGSWPLSEVRLDPANGAEGFSDTSFRRLVRRD